MDIHFDWQACDSRVKICVSPARWLDFALQGSKKNIRNLWFSIIRIMNHIRPTFTHPVVSSSRRFSARAPVVQQGSIVTPCPAVGPSVFFLVHLLILFDRSPFSEAFPCSIYLLSTSNNGSIGFTPQRTSKMISLSKDILFVVDLGHLESFVGRILGAKIGSRKKSNKSASESMCNMSTTATCSVT